MRQPLRALAPAKLNLCLYLGPRRSDGLHEICSLFVPVTLADELSLGVAGDADAVECPGIEGPNLAAVALARFRERFDWTGGPVRLRIDKRIPVAAGLGGGSADAAAALRLARAASGIEPTPEALTELAFSIGADVPSQLEPAAAVVTGAGERVDSIEPLEVWAVLLSGVGALSTASVYARADELGLARPRVDDVELELRGALDAARNDPLALALLLENDLERVAAELEPAAEQALALLRDAGAPVARLSGSGPAAFGLYATRAEAEQAAAAITPRWPGGCVVVSSAPPGFGEPRPA